MNWRFVPNNGGQESGFHDAGVETFKGNLERYLAREAIQNSLDARDSANKPVIVKFDLLQIESGEIPDMTGLAATLRRCGEYWRKDTKAFDFFENATTLARARKVTALRISDFNTKGVTGSDSDREDCWYSLIRCSGSSSKHGDEGGSFGIGKNAPFAASQMRVVLYSTLTNQNGIAFQGVAKLVSHKHPDGGISQHIGFLGDDGGDSIRKKTDVPTAFRRTKPGTDVVILGYRADDSWEKEVVFAVLENFWPAIYFGNLEVNVAGAVINKRSLEQLLKAYSDDEDFSAHHYFRAYTNGASKRYSEELPSLRKVELRLLPGDTELPKRVAMIRKTGMVIYQKRFQSLVPFSGVFVCANAKGNRMLREMEPPRHDVWDPNHPEKNANRKAEHEFTVFIRDCVQKLAVSTDENVLDIPELSQYLPDDEDSPDDAFDGDEDSGAESVDRQPKAESIPGRKMKKQSAPLRPGSGDEPGDWDSDDDNGNGGSNGDNDDKKTGGHPSIAIEGRVYAKDLAKGIYAVIAKPIDAAKVDALLTITAIGDDASRHLVRISKARITGGIELGIPGSGVIGPVRLSSKARVIVEVQLVEPRKLALEVEAHETE